MGADEESKADFAVVLFVGLIVHGLFAEYLNRAPGLILANVNYVKKMIFPLEILPWVAVGSALFHSAISVAVLLTAQLVFQHMLAWTAVFLPAVLAPLLLPAIGSRGFFPRSESLCTISGRPSASSRRCCCSCHQRSNLPRRCPRTIACSFSSIR